MFYWFIFSNAKINQQVLENNSFHSEMKPGKCGGLCILLWKLNKPVQSYVNKIIQASALNICHYNIQQEIENKSQGKSR